MPIMLSRVLWAALACTTLLMASTTPEVAAFTRKDVRLATQVYNDRFYNEYGNYGNSRKAVYKWKTNVGKLQGFWTQVEELEMLIDAYEVTKDKQFKSRIRYLYHGIRDKHGLNWANNIFNDDIIWGVIACIRAYKIFNDGAMKTMAIDNFNLVWNRGWDNVAGGGIWWTTRKESKNTCVNAPMAIAGMLLFDATGDTSFKDRAHKIMTWTKKKLLDKSGSVGGALNPQGKVTQGWRTYTQGTFIGAAGMLHKAYPKEGWLTAANKATDFAKNKISNSKGILPDEYCDGLGDCPGFKSIFARWVGKFVKQHKRVKAYGAWLDKNARAAWGIRNDHGLMWAKFQKRTPNDNSKVTSWEAASGVSMMSAAFFYRDAKTQTV